MEQKSKDKSRLIIFLVIAYGLTYLMGILMWYGKTKGYDLYVFPTAQMMYPAAGVVLGFMLTNKGEKKLPMGFFIAVLATTAMLVVMAIVSVIVPIDPISLNGVELGVYSLCAQNLLIVCSIIALIFLIAAGKEKRAAVGLTRRNWKNAAIIIVVFLLLYLIRTIASTLLSGAIGGVGTQYTAAWLGIFKNPTVWATAATLPINYLLVFLAFFGEEYGWRYYLQPIMQKKFGLRLGIILLGVVWGLWHAPVDLFYYTQTSGPQMIVSQQITCITLGIFFGYAYMKTQNIWVPVCLHYLNNNLVPIITATFTANVLENQNVSWGELPLALLLNGVCFGLFLLADVFKKKGQPESVAEGQ